MPTWTRARQYPQRDPDGICAGSLRRQPPAGIGGGGVTRPQAPQSPSDATGGDSGVDVPEVKIEARRSSRSRASAKKAGTWMETAVATYLNRNVDDRIERRTKSGAKDRGDIGGVRIHGQRVVLEVKNTAKTNLGPWATEAETERGNDDALVGAVVHKRHGKGKPEDQWVTMTLAEFTALLTGNRDHINQEDE